MLKPLLGCEEQGVISPRIAQPAPSPQAHMKCFKPTVIPASHTWDIVSMAKSTPQLQSYLYAASLP